MRQIFDFLLQMSNDNAIINVTIDKWKRYIILKYKKASVTAIANNLNVSPSTVSRALSNAPGVSKELREKIKNYAHTVGYIPGPSTKKNTTIVKTNIVAMIVGDIRNPFYADLAFAVQKRLAEHGYLLSIFNSEYNKDKELEYLHIAETLGFAGIIQVTAVADKMGDELKKLTVPVVMLNRMISSFDTDVVLLDNFEAGYIATRYLIELGHKRIGFLLGQKESSSSIHRYEGYLKAMRNYDLPIQQRDILQGDLTMETAYQLAKEFVMDLANRPTAMIMSNDLSAHGFMAYFQEVGIEIPKMLSVVSFDNIRFMSAGSIPLTTIDPHVNEMGHIAADLIVERIKNPTKENERVILSPVLIERKSSIPYRETARK